MHACPGMAWTTRLCSTDLMIRHIRPSMHDVDLAPAGRLLEGEQLRVTYMTRWRLEKMINM